MNIAVYGVPHAGTQQLIDAVVRHLHAHTGIRACHLPHPAPLHRQTVENFGQEVHRLREKDATVLRREFLRAPDTARQACDVFFTDARYAVLDTSDPTAPACLVPLPDAEHTAYDAVFYLDPEPEAVAHRAGLPVETIQRWQDMEKHSLTRLCGERGMELIIIDEDTDSVCRFIQDFLHDADKSRFYAPGIARQYLAHINAAALPDTIMLLDCDNTLSCNDVSADFFALAGLDGSVLRKIFRGYRYTHYQFYRIAHSFDHTPRPRLEEAARAVLPRMRRNEPLLADLRAHTDCGKIAVTSGMIRAWGQMRAQGWFDAIIGYSLPNTDARFITPAVKAAIARALQGMGKRVLAVGDSLLDIPMLEQADAGYLIARDSAGVRRYFTEHPHSSIVQLGYSPCRYSQLTVQDALP